MKEVTVYKTVFQRKEKKKINYVDFIKHPEKVFELFGITNFREKLKEISSIEDADERNEEKRTFLPAVDFYGSNVMCIDIDEIRGKEELKQKIVSKLEKHPSCISCKDSVSDNLVAFFSYEGTDEDFPKIYYKLFLELTLDLQVNIDFLPDINRLRYVSLGNIYFYKEQVEPYIEMMDVETLPDIKKYVPEFEVNEKTKEKKLKRRVFHSR